jgi:prolipoprotein diacylglyceryl transferase
LLIYWSPDPVLFSFGLFKVHWYGLLFMLGFVLGYLILARIFRIEKRPVVVLENLLFSALLGSILGARLAHCLFYDPSFYFNNPIEILKIWEGGLASHGGGIGLLVTLGWFVYKSDQFSFLWLLDRVAIPTALAGALIRIANFVNSEIIGLPTSGSWGIIFERVDSIPRHPVQLYEAGLYLLTFLILWYFYPRLRNTNRNGILLGTFLIFVFIGRFSLEYLKVPQAAFEITYMTMGQILSIPYILLGVFLLTTAMKAPELSK